MQSDNITESVIQMSLSIEVTRILISKVLILKVLILYQFSSYSVTNKVKSIELMTRLMIRFNELFDL